MSEVIAGAQALLDLMPILILLMVIGSTLIVYSRGTLDSASMIGLFIFLVFGLGVIPMFRDAVSLTGEDEPRQLTYNFTVEHKGIEYKRGFFGPKKTYVLILSDGEKYPVPHDVYDRYETGDEVTITISADRQRVTFR
jgi:hypothetical protein